MFALVLFGLRLPGADAGGMPSRNLRCPAPTSGRRPSMAGSGHPPCARAGHHLSRGLERHGILTARFLPEPVSPLHVAAAAAIAVALLLKRALRVRFAAVPLPLLLLLLLPSIFPEAGPRHSPSRAQGVCGQPAMDGRRPAVGAGRGDAGGAHPCVRDGPRTPPRSRLASRPNPQAGRSRRRSSITTAGSTASLFHSLGRRTFFR